MNKLILIIGILVAILVLPIIIFFSSLVIVNVFYLATSCETDSACSATQYCGDSKNFGFCRTDMPVFCAQAKNCVERFCPTHKVPVNCNPTETISTYQPFYKNSEIIKAWRNQPEHYCLNNDDSLYELEKLQKNNVNCRNYMHP